jgi:hypothetical protein
MYLAYFDESGDPGLTNSPTTFFVLSCVMVHHSKWQASLDALVELRRLLRKQYGIPMADEIKAIDIRQGHGALRGLRFPPARRLLAYRRLLRWADAALPDVKIFAVALDKARASANGFEPRETAWDFALERVQTKCRKEDEHAMVFPDEGHAALIRRLMRRKRRHNRVPKKWGAGSIEAQMERIIEDPSDRRSIDSYFIQLADWCSFAAHRSKYVDPRNNFPDDMWDELGDRRLLEVNKLESGPPGIKVYPPKGSGPRK